jgi:DNA invertase Pin-like site-specific DNA recombinase
VNGRSTLPPAYPVLGGEGARNPAGSASDHGVGPSAPSPAQSGKKRTRVALYGRVSTNDQEGGSQLARLREWAAREGHEVVLERVDTATGRHVQRPGLTEVMAEARGHHVHVVAVCKVDRWARSVLHLASTVRELHELGVEFVAVDQGLRISRSRGDPTSELILNVLGAVAEWEASIISERTKESLAHLKATGKRLGRPPKKGIVSPTSGPHI